jgi:hypothetical protein
MAVVEFNCVVCGKSVKKHWYPYFTGQPRYCSQTCKSQGMSSSFKPDVSKEWLEDAYLVQRRNTYEIGAEVGRDPKTVWAWLKKYGIPTRPRGNPSHKSPPKGRAPGFKQSDATKQKIREARLRDGRVPYLVNGVHHMKSRTGPAHPNWKGGSTPDRQKVHTSPEWKAVVRLVIKRDGQCCQRCGRNIQAQEKKSFDIHHIVPFECVEMRVSPLNLILLCERCHYWVHGNENANREFILPCPDQTSSSPTVVPYTTVIAAKYYLNYLRQALG